MVELRLPMVEEFCGLHDIKWEIDMDPIFFGWKLRFRFKDMVTEMIVDRNEYEKSIMATGLQNSIIDTLNKLVRKELTVEKTSYNYYLGGRCNGRSKALWENVKKPEIKNVIFNDPATIVIWSDGEKTVVKCVNEEFDPEKGLAMAIAKKFMGTNKSKSNFNDIFKKWIPNE